MAKKKKNFFQKLRGNMAFNVIGGLIGLMTIFGVAISLIAYFSFSESYKSEYAVNTYHMADSVTPLVNGDHIDDYLNGGYTDEYAKTEQDLQTSCFKLNVSLIYVIKVDTTDYGRFTSIWNSVNNKVDDSKYTPWELGYQRNTSNDEYRAKYEKLYNKESLYETVFRFNTTDGQHPHITTLVPVRDSYGDVVAILCVQRPINEMAKKMIPHVIAIVASAVGMAVMVCVFAGLYINIAVIKPVNKISKETARFAKKSSLGEPLGDMSRYDVILDLAHSIDAMEQDTVNYIESITQITAEKEKIGAELSIASQIQQDSLPDVANNFKDNKYFNIFASMDPAKEVGGDFYNAFLIDDDHLGLIMADVSGKGVPAALFMMVTNVLISNTAQMGQRPSETLEYVNKMICLHNRAGMFVTVWLGILELSTGKLISTNAGHENPIIYRKGGMFEEIVEKHGFVIGGMPGMKYVEQEMTLNKGDKLFLYTDGLPEATNADNQMFKIERVIKTLNKCKEKSPEEILSSMSKEVNKFVGDAPQFDDLTMMCIEIK